MGDPSRSQAVSDCLSNSLILDMVISLQASFSSQAPSLLPWSPPLLHAGSAWPPFQPLAAICGTTNAPALPIRAERDGGRIMFEREGGRIMFERDGGRIMFAKGRAARDLDAARASERGLRQSSAGAVDACVTDRQRGFSRTQELHREAAAGRECVRV